MRLEEVRYLMREQIRGQAIYARREILTYLVRDRDMPLAWFTEGSRTPKIAWWRMFAVYLTAEICSRAWVAVAEAWRIDHTTVMHAHRKFNKLLDDGDTAVQYEIVEFHDHQQRKHRLTGRADAHSSASEI